MSVTCRKRIAYNAQEPGLIFLREILKPGILSQPRLNLVRDLYIDPPGVVKEAEIAYCFLHIRLIQQLLSAVLYRVVNFVDRLSCFRGELNLKPLVAVHHIGVIGELS